MLDKVEFVWQDRKRLLFFGLPWTFTKYSLTEERLFVESGLLNTVENEVRLYRIMDLQLTRSLIQRIFGLGTIVVNSADKSLGDFKLINIKNPKEVKETLSRLVESQRDSKRVVNREMMFGSDSFEDSDGGLD